MNAPSPFIQQLLAPLPLSELLDYRHEFEPPADQHLRFAQDWLRRYDERNGKGAK